jgi:VWFA-related protein
MIMHRLLLWLLFCGLLPAQEDQSITRFPLTVTNVFAPVLVYDRGGSIVNGLQPDQFRIFDNGKEQNIHAVDVTFVPMSVVVAIQANARAEQILRSVTKIGGLLKPILLGDQGEAAVLAFDSRIRTMQDFTSDADAITAAVRKINPGNTPSHLVDAVEESIRMLNSRNKDRRRILIVIGETRGVGDEARPRETLIALQLANVTAYWIDMSHLVGLLTAPPPSPRPNNNPPASHPLPGGVPATPTTEAQMYGTNGGRAEFIPLMVELFKDAKSIFTRSQAELFTRGSGGNEFSFYTQKNLEAAIQTISDQLHSQYLITYSPNNKEEPGFHQLSVEVIGHANYRCETRPGYWVASLAAKQ